jgi:hypothetical protein
MLAETYHVADSLAGTIEYQIVQFTDTVATPDKVYYLLERKSTSTSRYWGTYVFNPAPFRPTLVIQCPHPLHDSRTGQQGFYAFRKAGARAYFVSGTHRCNGLTASTCDGTTTSCSETYQAYRYSDQAHVVLGPFQITTEEMQTAIPNLMVLQPHGFGQGVGDPDVIMSNGTRYTPIDDHLLTLRDNLLIEDPTLTFKIAHIDLDWNELIGRDNTQGRLINGSADPCGTLATSTTGRFFHLEQKYTGLRDTRANWDKLADAIIATFPPLIGFASAQSGSWTDPDTWVGGTIPGPGDDVLITAGQTITVDDTAANCQDLTFGGNDALIDLNAKSRLNIYGNMTLFSETHNAFSAGWSADSAYVMFRGNLPAVIAGWSTSGGSSSFRDLIIAKDSGVTVRTGGNGMRFAVQHSLEIRSGGFVLAVDDDFESRWASSGNFTNDQQLTIVIQPGAEFSMEDGTNSHWVRANAGSVPIGPMTVYGSALLMDASSSDISINGITIKAGGTLNLNTGLGSTSSGAMFNPGTIAIDSGASLLQETTSSIWFDTSKVVLSDGGVYKTSSSTTVFPPTLINNGRVRYQRNPATATTDQTVIDTNYLDIEFSFAGNGTKKLWNVLANRHVTDSFEVNNSATLALTGNGSSIQVDSVLRLTSGTIDNSAGSSNLMLSNNALISRATGQVTNPPSYAGQIDLRYTSSLTSVTTGAELPVGTATLRNLTINSPGQIVTLGADVTVNGQLALTDGILSTGTFRVVLASAATIVEDTDNVVQGHVRTTRTASTGSTQAFGGLGLQITAAGAAPGSTQIDRITGSPVTLGTGQGIGRYFEIRPTIRIGVNSTVILSYAQGELNGLAETSLSLYRSLDSGGTWALVEGCTVDTANNRITVAALNDLGWLTAGFANPSCCEGTTGNVNGSVAETPDLSDLSLLIAYLTQSPKPSLSCFDEANVTASGTIDLSDLSMMISHLTFTPRPTLPNCP